MISIRHRFHGHGSLNFTYRRGKTVHTELVSLRFVPARDENQRLAVVVSKKVQKSAVVRNRIRRRVFEQFRLIKKNSDWPPLDMVVAVFDERIATLSPDELKHTILSLLQKADTKPTRK